MPVKLRATQLVAVDAVAIDLETTGLDPRSARVVQIGAVRIGEGAPNAGEQFSTLVDPGVAIPPASTAIHGLSNADVAGAPAFREAFASLRAFLDGRPVVGHAVGFDLAVIAEEARRAGEGAWEPPFLDTRLLAEACMPALPGYTLETLAAKLGLDLADRHSALGDARSAGLIFRALIPHLRARGIRTWAEAEAACRRLPREAAAVDTGWAEIRPPLPGEAGSGLARIDSYPYRHRVADVMAKQPLFLEPGASLLEAARAMAAGRVSSLFVRDGDRTGILTERDVLRAVAGSGEGALGESALPSASFPLKTVPADAFIYRAIGRMARLKVRHLGVVDAEGALVGALSARDLLRLRASDAIRLGDAIDTAESVPALAAAWAPLALVAEALMAEDVAAIDVAAVISRELGAATRRTAELAEARLAAEGMTPPCPYAVLVLGSAGRGESLLALDQDNAIVFATGSPDGPEDKYFARLGAIVADTLDTIGVPYCKGGVMAREPAWRGSVETWRERVAGWLSRSNPQDLLSVDIFFDARVVHGAASLAQSVLSGAHAEASRAPQFAKLLAEATPRPPASVGLLGGIRTEDGRIDLKRAALLAIVSSARVLAMRHGIDARSTQERILAIEALKKGGEADLASLRAAHQTVLAAILGQQVRDIRVGVPPSSRVEVGRLSRHEKDELKRALDAVSRLEGLVRDLMF